jgi:plastocyanin
LSTRAGASFQIAFSNADAAIPHNVTIGRGGSLAFNGTPIITGPASATYAVPALAAGDYVLGCIVHPAMTGTLTVR